jgi:hypothetical protein
MNAYDLKQDLERIDWLLTTGGASNVVVARVAIDALIKECNDELGEEDDDDDDD